MYVPEVPAPAAGRGPTVVMLHGQPGAASDFWRVLPLVGDLTTIVPDRPGYYDGTPATGLFENAEQLLALLDRHQIERAVLCGYSMGAPIALAAAIMAPDRVASLVLLAPPDVRPVASLGDRITAAVPAMAVLAAEPARTVVAAVVRRCSSRLARLLAVASGSDLDQIALRTMAAGMTGADHGAMWQAFHTEQRAYVRQIGRIDAALDGIEVPAVVLGAKRDRVVGPAPAASIARRLPSAELRWAEAGHLVLLEHAQAVAAAIRRGVELSGLDQGLCGQPSPVGQRRRVPGTIRRAVLRWIGKPAMPDRTAPLASGAPARR